MTGGDKSCSILLKQFLLNQNIGCSTTSVQNETKKKDGNNKQPEQSANKVHSINLALLRPSNNLAIVLRNFNL